MSLNITQLAGLPSRTNTGASDNLLASDGVVNHNRAGAVTENLPAIAGVRGRTFYVRNQNNTATVTITPSAGQTINGGATYVLAVGVSFTKPCVAIYAPMAGTDWLVLTQTPL